MLKRSKVADADDTISSIEWDVHSFFLAPGIYYRPDGEAGKVRHYGLGPSMVPEKYGYRLGTKEEVDVIKKPKRDEHE